MSLSLSLSLPLLLPLSLSLFTCGIVNVGLSNGVDESSVKGVVDKGGVSIGNVGGGIGQSIPGVNLEICIFSNVRFFKLTILRIVTFAYMSVFSWKDRRYPRAARGAIDNFICLCIYICIYFFSYASSSTLHPRQSVTL